MRPQPSSTCSAGPHWKAARRSKWSPRVFSPRSPAPSACACCRTPLIGEVRSTISTRWPSPGGFEEYGFYEEAFSEAVGDVIRDFRPFVPAHRVDLCRRAADRPRRRAHRSLRHHLSPRRAVGVGGSSQSTMSTCSTSRSSATPTSSHRPHRRPRSTSPSHLLEILTDRDNADQIRVLMGFGFPMIVSVRFQNTCGCRTILEMPENTSDEREVTQGVISNILFSNEENGWCVVRLEPEDQPPLTAIGPLLGIRKGDELRLSGRWVDHPRYGRQFEAESYVQVAPSTIEGLRRYLGSGKIRGLGPKRAEPVVEAFGLDTLDVLENEPERLARDPRNRTRNPRKDPRVVGTPPRHSADHGLSHRPRSFTRRLRSRSSSATVRPRSRSCGRTLTGSRRTSSASVFSPPTASLASSGSPPRRPNGSRRACSHTLAGGRGPGPRLPARGPAHSHRFGTSRGSRAR